jgi:hypothetical protein
MYVTYNNYDRYRIGGVNPILPICTSIYKKKGKDVKPNILIKHDTVEISEEAKQLYERNKK